jgi:cytidylate kinase
MKDNEIIAIDGPSGAGKSTVAKKVANSLSFEYLDTGAMYRAAALAVIRAKIEPAHTNELILLVSKLDIDFGINGVTLNNKEVEDYIRSEEVSQYASTLSVIPGIRRILQDTQRIWARRHPRAVIEGRDIGTAIVPDARLKIFLTADLDERAKRRALERNLSETQVARHLKERDIRDQERSDSPLRVAEDAIVIDSTKKSVEEVTEVILELWKKTGAD